MAHERIGDVDCLGVGSARVTLERRLVGRWRGRVVRDEERRPLKRVRGRSHGQLMSPLDALYVSGSPDEVDERRRSLEAVIGGVVVESVVTASRDHVESVLCRPDALTCLADGARGVPVPVALARLGRWLEPSRSVYVYWGLGPHRWLARSFRGRRKGRSRSKVPCYALTPIDTDGWNVIWERGSTGVLSPPPGLLPKIDPVALLAVGVALAANDPGSFPPANERRFPPIPPELAAAAWLAFAGVRTIQVERMLSRERDALSAEQSLAELERLALRPTPWRRSLPAEKAERP